VRNLQLKFKYHAQIFVTASSSIFFPCITLKYSLDSSSY